MWNAMDNRVECIGNAITWQDKQNNGLDQITFCQPMSQSVAIACNTYIALTKHFTDYHKNFVEKKYNRMEIPSIFFLQFRRQTEKLRPLCFVWNLFNAVHIKTKGRFEHPNDDCAASMAFVIRLTNKEIQSSP